MTEKGKERLKKVGHVALTTLAFALISALIGGICWAYAKTQAKAKEETQAVAVLSSPKRAQDGAQYSITNVGSGTSLELWANGYVNYQIASGATQSLLWNNSITYTAKYADDMPFIAGNSPGNSNYSTIALTWEVEYAQTIFITKNDPTFTIYNDFLAATGETLRATDEELRDVLVLDGQTSTTKTYSQIVGAIFYHSPGEEMKVGTTQGGYDLQNAGRNWEATPQTLTNLAANGTTSIYFTPNRLSYVLYNRALTDIEYATPRDTGQITWYPLSTGEKVTIYSDTQVVLLRSKNWFQFDYKGATYSPIYYPEGVSDEDFAGYYFQGLYDLDGDITLRPNENADAPQATTILENTFVLIASAFSALMPLLNLKIIEDITLGFLLFIPLTFAIIVLIFKLIKL